LKGKNKMTKKIDCRLKKNKGLVSCKKKNSSKKKPIATIKKKIKREPVSFTAMLISLSIFIFTIISKPAPIAVENMSIFSKSGVLYIPIALIFGIIAIISAIFFFRRKK